MSERSHTSERPRFLLCLWCSGPMPLFLKFLPCFRTSEVRIRAVRLLIGLSFTWFTCYWFPEELISPLAIPLIDLPVDSYFVRTQSTEALSTYVETSSIACSYFVFASIIHQIGCFYLPSCSGELRAKYMHLFSFSGSCFSLFLFLTPTPVVPNVWLFLLQMGKTSTKALMIKLQPKIYDHLMFSVRISFIPSVCSLLPVILISLPAFLPEQFGIYVETSSNNRSFLLLCSILTAALSTPPDLLCQIHAGFIIIIQIEFAILVASMIVQWRSLTTNDNE